MKKIMIGLGVFGVATLPIVTAISCGNESNEHTATYEDWNTRTKFIVTYDKDNKVSSMVVDSEIYLTDIQIKTMLYTIMQSDQPNANDRESLRVYYESFHNTPIVVTQLAPQPTIGNVPPVQPTGNNPQGGTQTGGTTNTQVGTTTQTQNPITTGQTTNTQTQDPVTTGQTTNTQPGPITQGGTQTGGTTNPQGGTPTQTQGADTTGGTTNTQQGPTTQTVDPILAINNEQTRVNGLSFSVSSETQSDFAGITSKTLLTQELANKFGLGALLSNNAFTYYITNAGGFDTTYTSTTVTILVAQGNNEATVTPVARPVTLTPKSIAQAPGPVVNQDRDDANKEQTRVNGLSFTAGSETQSDFAGITSKTLVTPPLANTFGLNTLLSNNDFHYYITEAPAFTTTSTSTTIKILVEKNGEAATVLPSARTVTLTPKAITPVANPVSNTPAPTISVEDEIAEMTKVKAVSDRTGWSNFTTSLFDDITDGASINAKVYETEYINFAFDKDLNISDTVAREIISKFYEYTNWGFGLMSMDTILITNNDFGSAGRGGAAKDIILHIEDNSEDQLQILFDVLQHEYGHHETMKSSGLVGGSQERMRNLISHNAPATNIISVTAPDTLTWQENYIPNKDTDPNVLALKDEIWNNIYDNYASEPRVTTQTDSQGRVTGGTIDPSQLGNLLAGLQSGQGLPTAPQVQPLTHQNQSDYKVRLADIYTAPIFTSSPASIDKYITRNDAYYMDLAYQFNQYEYLNNTMNIIEFEPLHDSMYRNGSSVFDNDNLAFYFTGSNHSEAILDPSTGLYNQVNVQKVIDLWAEYVYGYMSNGNDTNQMYYNDIFVGGYGSNLPDFDFINMRTTIGTRTTTNSIEMKSIPTHFLSGRTSYDTHATWDTSHRAYYAERDDESDGTYAKTDTPKFYIDIDNDGVYASGTDQDVTLPLIQSVNH